MNIGDHIGKWVITEICKERANDGHMLVSAKCSLCGFIKEKTQVGTLKYYESKTCNHFVLRCHWFSKRIHRIYQTMITRCHNKLSKDYKSYGAKGIYICDEWLNSPQKFNDWAVENGYTDELTIDRIDPDKGYSPENCRWVTKRFNSKWKSTTTIIEVNGIKDSCRGWSCRLGHGITYISRYIKKHCVDNCIKYIEDKLCDM